MGDLTGKVILVTGAGKGSGRRVAERLADRGASLAVNDISPVNLDETLARLQASGGQSKAYVEDIAKKMPVQALLNTVLDDFGRIDVLVNCAQVEPHKSVLEMDDWEWQRTLDVNLTGAFLLTQSVGRIMKANSGGAIIHMGIRKSRVEAEQPDGLERRAAYLTSKAGLAALVQATAMEFAAFGVRVHHVDSVEEALKLCGG